MFSKNSRSTVGPSKPKSSSKTVLSFLSIFAFCWCAFITFRLYQQRQHRSIETSTIDFVPESFKPIKRVDEQRAIDESRQAVKRVESDVSGSGDTMHVVFSTDCSFFQDWQTLLIFHSAIEVGQKGGITRIASGCDEEKQEQLVALYKKLYPMYFVHFTPDFKTDKKTAESYDFYNKPYGVQHWLDFAVPQIPDGVVIAIIDPDMVFLRPLTNRIKEDNSIFSEGSSNPPEFISKGFPAAQRYGLGAPWAGKPDKNFNRSAVCGPNSPCMKVNHNYGTIHYSVGPPYILERSDLRRLTNSWVTFVPRVFERYPELLAEMFAYSMAGAHEELPHFTSNHYMVSNTGSTEEGWPWVDVLENDVCVPPVLSGKVEPITGIPEWRYYPGKPMPTLLHFCQFFRAGIVGFHKRRLLKEVVNCDFPLLLELPNDLAKLNHKIRDGERIQVGRTEARRNSFSLCVLHRSINSMLTYYKQNMCPKGSYINGNKTLNAVQWPYKSHWEPKPKEQ